MPSSALNKKNNMFIFNDTATTEIYTLSLHDALPILPRRDRALQSRRDQSQQDSLKKHSPVEPVVFGVLPQAETQRFELRGQFHLLFGSAIGQIGRAHV